MAGGSGSGQRQPRNITWEYAEAYGVADRMVAVLGSDFGRTNYYRSLIPI